MEWRGKKRMKSDLAETTGLPGFAGRVLYHEPVMTRSDCEAESPSEATRAVEAACSERGVRLTPMRRAAYEAMVAYAAPISAYELLERMQQSTGKRLAPPTVYRALDFLLEEGFVHRIESRNAFVVCDHPGDRHESMYFVCRECGASHEAHDPDVRASLDAHARGLGFTPQRKVVEVYGLCAQCQPHS